MLHCILTIISVAVCSCAGRQHLLDIVQVAVIDLRLDAQNVAHEWVDIDRLKGLHYQVPVEGRTHGSEEGLHVHLLVIVAVLTFVELHWKILWETCRRCISCCLLKFWPLLHSLAWPAEGGVDQLIETVARYKVLLVSSGKGAELGGGT